MYFSTLLIASLASTTLALPSLTSFKHKVPSLFARQSCVDTCGSVCYWDSDISAAVNEGYSLYSSGSHAGSGEGYPHSFEDYEGLPMAVDGPYQEYPILSSFQVYTGGPPGPDRVVFNTNGELSAVVTHTGASGNDFVSCNGS